MHYIGVFRTLANIEVGLGLSAKLVSDLSVNYFWKTFHFRYFTAIILIRLLSQYPTFLFSTDIPTLEFQIEGEEEINGEAGKFRPK